MGDPADVRFVDPHAEGNRGHHDQPVFLLKATLHLASVIGFHAAVVVTGTVARLSQRVGECFGFCPCPAIDDAGLPFAGCGEVEDLRARTIFDGKRKVDVGAIKATQESFRLLAREKLGNDLFPRLCVSGRREGGEGDIKRLAQGADAQIIGAEVVTPLADAMCLIDGNEIDVGAAQHRDGAAGRKAFGRHVKQLQPASRQLVPDSIGFFVCIAGGERARLNPCFPQATHLIPHQSD